LWVRGWVCVCMPARIDRQNRVCTAGGSTSKRSCSCCGTRCAWRCASLLRSESQAGAVGCHGAAASNTAPPHPRSPLLLLQTRTPVSDVVLLLGEHGPTHPRIRRRRPRSARRLLARVQPAGESQSRALRSAVLHGAVQLTAPSHAHLHACLHAHAHDYGCGHLATVDRVADVRQLSLPFPPGYQLDWEGIFSPSPALFVAAAMVRTHTHANTHTRTRTHTRTCTRAHTLCRAWCPCGCPGAPSLYPVCRRLAAGHGMMPACGCSPWCTRR
jgi:hypothetical protein